jgi:uncharacterized protein YlxW (UPF0749 family)
MTNENGPGTNSEDPEPQPTTDGETTSASAPKPAGGPRAALRSRPSTESESVARPEPEGEAQPQTPQPSCLRPGGKDQRRQATRESPSGLPGESRARRDGADRPPQEPRARQGATEQPPSPPRVPLPPAAPARATRPEPANAPRRESAAAPAEATGRQRLKAVLWPVTVSRAQLIVALLLFVLGLGLAIQVRSTNDHSALRGARQEDLVRILDELDNRTQRLDDEKRRLDQQRTELENSSDQAEEARRQTEQKAAQLGVLAGSVAAEGPGITVTIRDPNGSVEADMLLDTLQELRAAGAEAIQINDVRVVADTYFSGDSGGVEIDGRRVARPYRFKVIGNPVDLEPALNIPGGVVQTLEKEQATVDVVRSKRIVVDALRPSEQPDYAQSSSQ